MGWKEISVGTFFQGSFAVEKKGNDFIGLSELGSLIT